MTDILNEVHECFLRCLQDDVVGENFNVLLFKAFKNSLLTGKIFKYATFQVLN